MRQIVADWFDGALGDRFVDTGSIAFAQDSFIGSANPYVPFGTNPMVPYGTWAQH